MLIISLGKVTGEVRSHTTSEKATLESIGDNNDKRNLKKAANSNDIGLSRATASGTNMGTKCRNTECHVRAPSRQIEPGENTVRNTGKTEHFKLTF